MTQKQFPAQQPVRSEHVIGLYAANRLGGVGACVVSTSGEVMTQATLLQFGQTTQKEEALKILAKWATTYGVGIIGIANGVMFQEIDKLVHTLITRYPDMALCRMPVDDNLLAKTDNLEHKAIDVTKNIDIALAERVAARRCQTEHIQSLKSGMPVDGVVLQIKPFGTFLDVGVGIPGLLHRTAPKSYTIGELQAVRIKHVDSKKGKITLMTTAAKKPAKNTGKPSETAKTAKPKAPVNSAMADALMKLKRGTS